MNESFSEYVLHEPILRILTARGISVECEYICPGIQQPARGDKKKLDFYAESDTATLAIEVKWIKSSRLSVVGDIQKLKSVKRIQPETSAVLCIFGRKSDVDGFIPTEPRLEERGKLVVADFGKTRYACRIYELKTRDE